MVKRPSSRQSAPDWHSPPPIKQISSWREAEWASIPHSRRARANQGSGYKKRGRVIRRSRSLGFRAPPRLNGEDANGPREVGERSLSLRALPGAGGRRDCGAAAPSPHALTRKGWGSAGGCGKSAGEKGDWAGFALPGCSSQKCGPTEVSRVVLVLRQRLAVEPSSRWGRSRPRNDYAAFLHWALQDTAEFSGGPAIAKADWGSHDPPNLSRTWPAFLETQAVGLVWLDVCSVNFLGWFGAPWWWLS